MDSLSINRSLARMSHEILEENTMILVYPIPEAGSLVSSELYLKYKLRSYFSTKTFDELWYYLWGNFSIHRTHQG